MNTRAIRSTVVALIALAAGPAAGVTLPRPSHVIVVIEENHAFQQIVGNRSAPYLNALIAEGALLTRSHGVSYPSQPNYLALFSGSTHGVRDNSCPHTFRTRNLGAELIAAGLGFAGYSQSMPYGGYTGCQAGAYARKHNPWVNFANVPRAANRPFGAFPDDLDTLPTVAFVVPDELHDMHDGSIDMADAWLERNLGPYVEWARTHDALLIVTWDEDDQRSGNHIATILAGPMVVPGRYDARVNHYGVLRTILAMYGLVPMARAARARPITDVWSLPVLTSPGAAAGTVGRPFVHRLVAKSPTPTAFAAASSLPPGLVLAGDAITGVPEATGVVRLDVGATNHAGTTAQPLVLLVDRDSDGDGAPDDLESALGTGPLDPRSRPARVDGTLPPPEVRGIAIRLDAATAGRDVIELVAALPRGAVDRGSPFTVDVGGVVRTFVHAGGARWAAAPPSVGARCRVRPRGDGDRLTVRLRGSFRDALADEGLGDGTIRGTRTGVLVRLVVGGTLVQTAVPVLYAADAGGSGIARGPAE